MSKNIREILDTLKDKLKKEQDPKRRKEIRAEIKNWIDNAEVYEYARGK